MIRPGLFTASTSSADHFVISGDCVLLIVFRSFGLVVLKMWVPPRSESGSRLGARLRTPAVTKWRTWSEAESCAGGLSANNLEQRGMAKLEISAERKCSRVLIGLAVALSGRLTWSRWEAKCQKRQKPNKVLRVLLCAKHLPNFAALRSCHWKCAALALPKAPSEKLERVTAEQVRSRSDSNGSISAKQQEVLRLNHEH